jgi:hypothetical protein
VHCATAAVYTWLVDGLRSYWLSSGFHRVAARRAAGIDSIPCEVRQGGLRDAILFAASTNHEHGLVRSEDDKRRAVLMVHGVVGGTWPQKQIAAHTHVSKQWVSDVLGQGTQAPPTTSQKKRAAVAAALAAEPNASDRKLGRAAGVDHKTVASVRGEDGRRRQRRASPATAARPAAHATPPPDTGATTAAYSSPAARDTARAALHAVKQAHGGLRSPSDRALLANEVVALGRELGGVVG